MPREFRTVLLVTSLPSMESIVIGDVISGGWPAVPTQPEPEYNGIYQLISHSTQPPPPSPPRAIGPPFRRRCFQMHLVNEIFCILIRIPLSFVPEVRINYKSSLVQVMAWHRTGNQPLSHSMRRYFIDIFFICVRRSAVFSLCTIMPLKNPAEVSLLTIVKLG